MARRPVPTWLIALWCTLLPVVGHGAPVPRLLAPVPGAVIHAPEFLLVYTVPTETSTRVLVDDLDAPDSGKLVPGDKDDLHHRTIRVPEGRHRVRVVRTTDEVELFSVAVTYIPSYSLRTANAPGDRDYTFHTAEREGACTGCHNLPAVFETEGNRPSSPAGKVCSACHPSVEAGPNLHGPAAVYACFQCHEPRYTPARFSLKTSQSASCGGCHDDFLARIMGARQHVHGPVAAGSCTVCHDPHGGFTNAVLREEPPDLCLECHAQTLPLPVGKQLHAKLRCTGCHDPHGGKTPILTKRDGNALCGGCHKAITGSDRGHPLDGHPVQAEVDPSHPTRSLSCLSCHDPHGTRDVSRRNIIENEEAQRKFCRKCHY